MEAGADPFAPVELGLLEQRDAAATRAFCEQVRRRGLAVLRVTEREAVDGDMKTPPARGADGVV